MPVTINGDGSITGLSVGGLGNGGIVDAGSIASNAVGATQLNLADNYAFTGTVSTPNGYNLLATKNDSSSTNYNSNTLVFD